MKKIHIIKKFFQIKYIRLTIIGIILATFFWLGFFSKRLLPKIIDASIIESENQINNMLYSIVNDSVRKFDKNNFLVFKNNKNGELVLTEYNMDEIYRLIELINKQIIKRNQDYVFFVPSGMISKKFLLNHWGSKVPVMAKIANNMYANVKTKVRNYGINNALVEIYVVFEVRNQLLVPFEKKTISKKYEILVSSYFINGKVPGIYGEKFEFSSNIFDITLKI